MILYQNIQRFLLRFNIVEKFIVYNCFVFGVIAVFNAIYTLSTGNYLSFFSDYTGLPENLGELIFKPWTILSYSFVHLSFLHLFWNIVALYFFGRIFLLFYNKNQFIKHYILGGVFAGFIFVLAYNTFPALIEKEAVLFGASASIFSILFGVTALRPSYLFNLYGLIQIPLWVICSLYTLLFISTLPYDNTGGELSHLGGAFFGYFYSSQLKKGKDFASGFERIMDTVTNWFKPKSNLKTVYRKANKKGDDKKTKQNFETYTKQKNVDIILDKISKSGYDSLTEKEKEFLFRAGKD